MKAGKVAISRISQEADDICLITAINPGKVSSVLKRMEPAGSLLKVAETFNALGDLTRTKIITALAIEELCVCDIAALLNTTKSAVSHQLRILRNMRIVKYRKEGKMVFYSLDDQHVTSLIQECLRHVNEEAGMKSTECYEEI
jgi:ArsR family transcriptional regulator, lead/cadmium/zinc/bismuth-responsive transcriptional repressor